jgi:tetratricopeptide (TPR) repeat protein
MDKRLKKSTSTAKSAAKSSDRPPGKGFSGGASTADHELLQAALIAHETGDAGLACAWCDEILGRAPAMLAARRLRGLIALQTGDLARGIVELEQVLRSDPSDYDSRINLGNGYADQGDPQRAIEQYRRVLSAQPGRDEASINLALALAELDQDGQALKILDDMVARSPQAAAAHALRGDLLRRGQRWADAEQAYRHAHLLNPADSEVLFGLGAALARQGQLHDALRCLDEGIAGFGRLSRPSALAHCERAAAHARLGQHTQALADFDAAIALDPANAVAHSGRGNLLAASKQLEAALSCYDRAIALDPVDPVFIWNKALALLRAGDFARGWPLFESRWLTEPQHRRDFAQPLWLGAESIRGRTILLHAEQGLGDTLQFVRYAAEVDALGATVIVEAPAELCRLCATVPGVSQVVARGWELPAFDVHCPLLSLPMALNSQLATIPATVPYVHPDDTATHRWAQRLVDQRAPRLSSPQTQAQPQAQRRPRVGLVWSSGFRPGMPDTWFVNARRNLPLEKLRVLKDLPIDFYSLQKGEPAEGEFRTAMATGWNGPAIHHWPEQLSDFAETAALIANLDLVISVDTSTAHLAGALGKPVWILLRYDACWRWLLEGNSSPWYPSARLYRQKTFGDWDDVIERVRTDLTQFLPQTITE